MTDNSLYETPKSSSEAPVDKLASFGGWLRFFQVTSIIYLIIIVLLVLVIGVSNSMFGSDIDLVQEELILFIFESTAQVIIFVLLLKNLAIRSTETPTKLISLISISFAISALSYGISYYMFKQEMISEKPTGIFGEVVYFLIWTSYFKKSKRVKAYYGANGKEVSFKKEKAS